MLPRDQQIVLGAVRTAMRHTEYFLSRNDHAPAAVYGRVVEELLWRADLDAWRLDVTAAPILWQWKRLRAQVAHPPESMASYVESRCKQFEHEALMAIVQRDTLAQDEAMRARRSA